MLGDSPSRVARIALPSIAALGVTAFGIAVLFALSRPVAASSPPGPPFPPPVAGERVYDTAGIFRADTLTRVRALIAQAESTSQAQIVVYTQVKPQSDTPAEAQADADALGTQWGVGRQGFDDGLVILFDLDTSLCHGQVQLDAGAGFAAAYLSNAQRNAIYQNQMLPHLRSCDLDGALLAGMDQIVAALSPEHAATLERARQVDSVIGLVGAPLIFLLLVGFIGFEWLRYGRDPVYLDDPSIYIPAPPSDLSPAAAALIFDGRSSRRTLTTAMLDLASRGDLAFEQDQTGLLGLSKKLAILINPEAKADPDARTGVGRQREALGAAERLAFDKLIQCSIGGRVENEELLAFGNYAVDFDKELEAGVVAHQWFRDAPGAVTRRWRIAALIVAGIGAAAIFAGANLPSGGLVLLGIASLLTALVWALVAGAMPARTMPGAMIRAMLAAYRRTLDKTMAQARSMNEVVRDSELAWLKTPDQAVVWGVALGLGRDVERVLSRTAGDLAAGTAIPAGTYLPLWYGTAASGGGLAGGSGGGSGGLMSSSAIPNFGGMMAALGTIGNVPSSSGGGGGGLGGGGGFGGGGAGGGF